MRKKNTLLMAALTATVLTTAPAAARAASEITIPVALPAAYVNSAVSADGAGAALVAEENGGRYRVLHQDPRGHWRSFSVPHTHRGSPRVALLGGGAGLAAWDEGDRVLVRSWDAAGDVAAPQAVLGGVQTIWDGDFTAYEWALSSDGRGTVAIAAPGLGVGGIYATVRDRGGAFGPQQLLAPAPAGVTDFQPDQAALDVAPIGAGGAVTVQWDSAQGNPGRVVPRDGRPTFQVTRPGPGQPFGPVQSPVVVPTPTLSDAAWAHASAPAAVQADQSATVRVGADVLALCRPTGCTTPQRVSWGGRVRAIVFNRLLAAACSCYDRWYVATRRADGTFAAPRRAPAALRPDRLPLESSIAGVVGVARVVPVGDGSRIVVTRVRVG
jgi:hypothetical protein